MKTDLRTAVAAMRALQIRYEEASRTNSFPATLLDQRRAAERLVDELLKPAQPSLFGEGA